MSAKYFIKTLGCQMNKNDSERIAGLLNLSGMTQAFQELLADVLIINTCSVRKQAEDRIFGIIKNWLKLKKKKPHLILAITGCLAGRDEKGKIREKFKEVDLFFSIDDLGQLPKWLMELNPQLNLSLNNLFFKEYLDISPKRSNQIKGFISIQTGCNNFCSYCVVPYARGRERNRSVLSILEEVKNFVSEGGFDITLLGQVVNHYIAPDSENFSKNNPFKKQDDFAALLWEVNQIKGLKRIHFTAPHPKFFNKAQIKALSLPKQINHLHLPVQSGDNEILKKMNRPYTREFYIKLVKEIREENPNLAIGTDIIVGFCGETEEQFENTLKLYEECQLDIGYIAQYSPRPKTLASKLYQDDVPKIEKKKRWDRLQALLEKQAFLLNQKYLEKEIEVLVDHCREGICSGYSRELKFVQFLSPEDLTDKLVIVKVKEAKEWILKGELLKIYE